MGRFILKIPNEDLYFEYSTVVDAPVTYAMPLAQFKDYYKEEYGNSGMKDLDRRLGRVFLKNTSSYDDENFEQAIFINRYGENETELNVEDFIKKIKKQSDISC